MRKNPRHPEIFVDAEGRVFRELTPSTDAAGYHQISNGKIRERRHVLVCEAYHGPRPFPGAQVRHIDGNPGNDSPRNLAWGTALDNGTDMILHGRSTRGEKNAGRVLTENQVRDIKMRSAAGEGAKALAADFQVSPATICDIRAGRTWGWLE